MSVKASATAGDKKAVKNLEVLKNLKAELLQDKLATQFATEEIVIELQLLTAKKQLYLLNGDKGDVKDSLKEKIKSLGADYVCLNLATSDDFSGLIKKSYEILDLISFLTTGEDETRAWTIKKGTKAPEAAGVIHTDFEKKFIRAEVVNWQKLLECGSWAKAREKAQLRLEGKEYVVQDGDVLVIRHG